LAHVTWLRAQPLSQSIFLKFSLETRLEFDSSLPLSAPELRVCKSTCHPIILAQKSLKPAGRVNHKLQQMYIFINQSKL